MSRFFLIDQSLINNGGHHYDYSTCIVAAARELGFETLIAANRKAPTDLTIAGIRVIPAFSETVYQKDSCLAGLRHLKRARQNTIATDATGWQRTKAAFAMHRFHRRRSRLVKKYATDFQNFFDRHPVVEDDHVFLTTVSELELMGLAKFLHSNPLSVLATWHLQFHFNVFEGRSPEYDSQKTTEQLARTSFQTSLAELTCHRMFFYTTSRPLAEQYNRLKVGEFTPLPYPVAPEFAQGVEQKSQLDSQLKSPVELRDVFAEEPRPLRLTCPGQIRREKGCADYLQPLVDQLWASHLANGTIKIAIQRPRKKFLRKEKIELQIPQSQIDTAHCSPPNGSPFEYFSHPLSRSEYIDFLKSADCGLLMYDSRAYYSRRAGVLGEMLACGKPLIVPAGSWLATQIAEPVFQHVDAIAHASSASARRLEIDELEWSMENAPSSGGVISFDGHKHPFSFSLNRRLKEHLLKIDFQWKWPTVAGTYCRICVRQSDGTGAVVAENVQTIGHRAGEQSPTALFRAAPCAQTIDITLSNAFGDSTAMIKHLSATMLGPAATATPHHPHVHVHDASLPGKAGILPTGESVNGSLQKSKRGQATTTMLPAGNRRQPLSVDSETALGRVGIVVADHSQLADAVREMVDHFDHYRDSARQFSKQWFAMHHPKRTIAHLIGASDRSG